MIRIRTFALVGFALAVSVHLWEVGPMKAVIIVLLSFSFFTVSIFGQSTSAREIAKKAVPKDQRTSPAPPAPPAATKSTQPRPAAVAVPVKTEKEKLEIEKKTVEFQKKRAKEGSASSQYDLGIRYLDGKGVEKDEKEGRKWLDAAARQGNTSAIKKVQELDKGKATAK